MAVFKLQLETELQSCHTPYGIKYEDIYYQAQQRLSWQLIVRYGISGTNNFSLYRFIFVYHELIHRQEEQMLMVWIMELGETAQFLGCMLCRQEDQMAFNPLSSCKWLLPFC